MYSTAVKESSSQGVRPVRLPMAWQATVGILAIATALGCNKTPTLFDSSTFVIEPGRGVTNICEIGMTFSQMRKLDGQATTHGIYDDSWSWKRWNRWKSGRFALIPSLGAIAFLGTDLPVSNIDFHVRPYASTTILGLKIRVPFRGKVGKVLSFKERAVTKQEVETAFGKIDREATNGSEALGLLERGRSFSRKRSANTEELCYSAQGVSFVLESDVVTSVQVFKANQPRADAELAPNR